MKKRKNIPIAVLATGLALIVLAGIFSPADRREGRQGKVTQASENDRPAETAAAGRPKDFDPAIYEATGYKISGEQKLMMETLLNYMKRGEFNLAASFLADHEGELGTLLADSFAGDRVLCGDEGFSRWPEGRGVVLKSPSVVFYGNFADGVPEGTVTALQQIELDEPRYDYSIGTWKNGKMNGNGVTGYLYYGGTGENDGLKTEKSGLFQDDRMEGEVRYTAVDRAGVSSTWNLAVTAGVTQIDDRWEHRKRSGQYILPSQNDRMNTYVLREEDAGAVLWKNRITWE